MVSPSPSEIADSLSAAERRVLVACVRFAAKQQRLLEASPQRIRNSYYAGGNEKRVARRLLAAGLLDPGSDFCASGSGSDIRPSELGCDVAARCAEWNVLPISRTYRQSR